MQQTYTFLAGTALALALALMTGCGGAESTPDNAANADEVVSAALQRAEDNRVIGKYEDAVAALTPIVERFPDRPEPRERLAEIFLEMGQPGKAADQFASAARLQDNPARLRLEAASAYALAGDLDNAARNYESYLELQPEDRQAWRTLSQIQMDRGDASKALFAFEQALGPTGPTNVGDGLALGDLYLANQQKVQAARVYKQVFEADPDGPLARIAVSGLAVLAVDGGDFEAAQALLDRAGMDTLAPNPSSPYAEAIERFRAWKGEQAPPAGSGSVAQATTGETINPAESAAAIAAGSLASASAENALEDLVPEAVGALTGKDGGAPQPIETVEPANTEAVLTAADDAEAPEGSGIAVTQIETVEPEELLPAPSGEATVGALIYDVRTDPETIRSVRLNNLIESATDARLDGNFPLAIRMYRSALAEAPEDAGLWYRLSQSYLADGQFRPAEMMSLEAQRLEPNNVSYKLHQIEIARRLYPERRLLEQIKAASAQFPDSPEVTLLLANAVRYIERDSRSAVFYYRQFLQQAGPGHPRRPEVEQAIERLLP
ncbi:MAG: tetratricopeptide repeat protein [Opitutales bacterium]